MAYTLASSVEQLPDSLTGVVYLVTGIVVGSIVAVPVVSAATDDGGLLYPTLVYVFVALGVALVSAPSVIEGYRSVEVGDE